MNKRIPRYLLLIAFEIIFIIFLFQIANVHAFEQKGIVTLYHVSTSEDLTIAWDDTNTDITDFFEFYLFNIGEKKNYSIGKTQLFQITLKLPRTGLYTFHCRSCSGPADDDTRECSDYVASDILDFAQIKNPNTGLYEPGKWMIYGHIGSPTDGTMVQE